MNPELANGHRLHDPAGGVDGPTAPADHRHRCRHCLYGLKARKAVDRLIAFDALSVVFVAALVIIGVQRRETGYLDIAMLVAMLGFVQTVAARLLERREFLRWAE